MPPSRSRRPFLGVIVAALLGTMTHVALGVPDVPSATSMPSTDRPDAGAGPTRVFVSIWVADIDSINSASQSYVANIFVALRWKDSRLIHTGQGPRMRDLGTVWNPRVLVANEIGMVRKTLPDAVEVAPDGVVTYRQRYVGTFSQPLKLHDFPFDSHVITFHLVSPGYTPSDIEFVPEDRWATHVGPHFAAAAGIAEDISLPDYDIQWCRTQALPYEAMPGMLTAGYALEFEARRHRGYFVWKLLLPLTLIIFMSWVVFWIDPASAGTQIAVATTAMLTLIAYRFALDQSVPRIEYLTRMDYFIIGSSILVFLALSQVVLTAHLAKADHLPFARRITAWGRVIFIALFIGLVCVSFIV